MIYETRADKAREDKIAAAFAFFLSCDWAREPGAYPCPEHKFFHPNGPIYSETKRRFNPFGYFDDFYIDKVKVEKTLRKSPERGILLIGFNDVFAIVRLAKHKPFKESFNGRRDRGDQYDIDKVVHFRWDAFEVVGKRENNYE